MPPHEKMKIYRSVKYLKWIRSRPCIICRRPSQAHHVRRSYWGSGIGIKPHDYVTIPFCIECHSPDTEKDLNVELIIINLLMEYIEGLKK